MRLYGVEMINFEYKFGILPTIKLGCFRNGQNDNFCTLVPVVYRDDTGDREVYDDYDFFVTKGSKGKKIAAFRLDEERENEERGAIIVIKDVEKIHFNNSTHKKVYLEASGINRNGLSKDYLIKVLYSEEPILIGVKFYPKDTIVWFTFIKGVLQKNEKLTGDLV